MKKFKFELEILDVNGIVNQCVEYFVTVNHTQIILRHPNLKLCIQNASFESDFRISVVKGIKELGNYSLVLSKFFTNGINFKRTWVKLKSKNNLNLKIHLKASLKENFEEQIIEKCDEFKEIEVNDSQNCEISEALPISLCPFFNTLNPLPNMLEKYSEILKSRIISEDLGSDSEIVLSLCIDSLLSPVAINLAEKFSIFNLKIEELRALPGKNLQGIIKFLVNNIKNSRDTALNLPFERNQLSEKIDERYNKQQFSLDYSKRITNESSEKSEEFLEFIRKKQEILEETHEAREKKRLILQKNDEISSKIAQEKLKNIKLKSTLIKNKIDQGQYKKNKQALGDSKIIEKKIESHFHNLENKLNENFEKLQTEKNKKDRVKLQIIEKIKGLEQRKNDLLSKNKILTEKIKKFDSSNHTNSEGPTRMYFKRCKELEEFSDKMVESINENKRKQKSAILLRRSIEENIFPLEKEILIEENHNFDYQLKVISDENLNCIQKSLLNKTSTENLFSKINELRKKQNSNISNILNVLGKNIKNVDKESEIILNDCKKLERLSETLI